MSDHAVRVLWCAAVCFSILLISGCGSALGTPTTVSGSVTVDGTPLANAPLAFQASGAVPADHRTFMAMTDSSGKYKIGRIYPGSYQVIVVESGGGQAPGAKQSAVATNPLQPAEGKELRVEIGSAPAVYDIKLVQK